MASCQTWTSSSHIRHPWFDAPLMKRKHLETVSPDEELGSSTFPASGPVSAKAPPPKRRRCSTLERGFAHLTLGTPIVDTGVGSTSVTSTETSLNVQEMSIVSNAMDAEMPSVPTHLNITRPYTIEESRAPEVKMKTSSWYEPEPNRIIITDMDSFTESDEEEGGTVSVNPVLLDRIRNSTLEASKAPVQPTSQALVLFKPLALGDREADIERLQQERRKKAGVESKGRVMDEDAMDIEP